MRLACFDDLRLGVVLPSGIVDVTGTLPSFLDELPEQRVNWVIAHWGDVGPEIELAADAAGEVVAIDAVELRAPNPGAPHVFALPANYRAHIGELGSRAVSKGRSAREQGFFLKAPGSLVGASANIELPRDSRRRFDHECELAVVIGRGGRDIAREDALTHVFGYSCLIDVTMRIEPGELEEERSMRKSFASFTPMGPYLVTADEIGDPQTLTGHLTVDGEERQVAETKDMIVGVTEAIELISCVVDLRPGDVIASGTPAGVGPIVPGNRVAIEFERVGAMELPVRERSAQAPRPADVRSVVV